MNSLTSDEQDALAVNCPWCWARPGERCKSRVTGKSRSRPHRKRIGRAGRRGVLGGVGKSMLDGKNK